LKIEVICYANFCRSPVAEKLIKHFGSKQNFNVASSGIIDFGMARMDKRSSKFLESHSIQDLNHICKEVNSNIIEQADIVLAMDMKVLQMLFSKFPKQNGKIKLFSKYSTENLIDDPYKFTDDDHYKYVMEKIYNCSKQWVDKLS
jgi:protein-tyrosine phosphatase